MLQIISDSDSDILQKELPVACIGATIGTHAGPGAIGVAFFAKNVQK